MNASGGGARLESPSMTAGGAALKAHGCPPICCANRFPPRPLRGAPLRCAALTAAPPPVSSTLVLDGEDASVGGHHGHGWRASERRRIACWRRWSRGSKSNSGAAPERRWRSGFSKRRRVISSGIARRGALAGLLREHRGRRFRARSDRNLRLVWTGAGSSR
jgi:hypothetical protein